MTTTYTFKFPDGKAVKNPVTGLTYNVEDIISEAAERNGGSSAGKKTNRGIRTMKVCFTGKNEKNRIMFDMECAVYKPDSRYIKQQLGRVLSGVGYIAADQNCDGERTKTVAL